ncbi:hypothetical protein ACIPRI_26160 [Variovorax sp. LARHSF232]
MRAWALVLRRAEARQRCDKARKALAHGVDPSIAKREEKQAKADAEANSFEIVSRDWIAKDGERARSGHTSQGHELA